MRSCHISRLGLAALTLVTWAVLTNWSEWSLGQDNPLRANRNIQPDTAKPADLEISAPTAQGPTALPPVAEEPTAIQERQLAERIASVCTQQFGPWMQWLTLVSQRPIKADANIAGEDDDAIIEIPEAALGALDPPELTEASKDGEAANEEVLTDSIVIGETSEEMLADNADQPGEIADEPARETTEVKESTKIKEITENKETTSGKERSVKDASSRNVRTPRSLLEVDAEDLEESTTPRALSQSMKSKSEEASAKETSAKETSAKRSIKSSDEDMRDYLAQEEPSPESIRNSTSDKMQGVDADRAAKPNTSDAPGNGIRSPNQKHAITDKPRAKIPVPMQQRLARVQSCLEHYLNNPETTTARSPWAAMHAILAYGADYELIGPNGRVNAIGWMCHNGLCRTQRIFTPRGDFFIPNVGGGVQGHEGQFLAILAQCQVPLDYPIQIGSKKFTVEDLVRYEMATCKEKSELTFKLIGLSYYVDADKQWRSNDGKVWNLEKLLREEIAQPVVGSACGGTHRLMGLSFCLRQRELQGLPINGQFARAAQFINEYVRYTWQIQNPDGSFSTNWYAGRGNEPNDERKVQTSGHMLEWLMFTVSDDELTSPRVEKAVDFLLSKIHDRRDFKWPIGPRGHATRALALYHLRIEALLEQRSGVPTTLAEERVHIEDTVKTGQSPSSPPTIRQGQVSPGGRPTSQPASRSTGRPNRRVRG